MKLRDFENIARRLLYDDQENVEVHDIIVKIRKRRRNWVLIYLFSIPLLVGVASLVYVQSMKHKEDLREKQLIKEYSFYQSAKQNGNLQKTTDEPIYLSSEDFDDSKNVETETSNSASSLIAKNEINLHNPIATPGRYNVMTEPLGSTFVLQELQYEKLYSWWESRNKRYESHLGISEDQVVENEGKLQTNEIIRHSFNHVSFLQAHKTELILLNRGHITIESNHPTFVNHPRWLFEISISGGPVFPVKKLFSKHTAEKEIVEKRMDAEASLTGLQLNSLLKISRTYLPVYLRTGCSYITFQEQLDLNETSVTHDTLQALLAVTISEQGDTISELLGNVVRQTEISRYGKVHYRVSQFDFPLLVGMEKRWKSWYGAVEGGVTVNLSTDVEGTILSQGGNFQDLEQSKIFKRNVGTGYLGRVIFGHFTGQHTKLTLSAAIKHFPGNYSSQEQNFKQRYTFYDLNLNLAYLIN